MRPLQPALYRSLSVTTRFLFSYRLSLQVLPPCQVWRLPADKRWKKCTFSTFNVLNWLLLIRESLLITDVPSGTTSILNYSSLYCWKDPCTYNGQIGTSDFSNEGTVWRQRVSLVNSTCTTTSLFNRHFFQRLCRVPRRSSNEEPLEIGGVIFYEPDALPVAQRTISKHWWSIISEIFGSSVGGISILCECDSRNDWWSHSVSILTAIFQMYLG